MTKGAWMVAACAMLLCAGTAQAVLTAQQKCERAKLKAQGTLQSCLKTSAASVIAGKADASATCQAKFTTALGKADAAATKAGTSCRYLDNGDDTVSDLNTGLMWEKKTNLDSSPNPNDPHDADNSYSWRSSVTGPVRDGTAYTDFLGGLNSCQSSDGSTATGGFAGYCDWRLPTVTELSGIIDATQGYCGTGTGPCIDSIFGPTQADGYWSSSANASNADQAWFVYFDGSGAGANGSSGYRYVRAVRGGL